MKVCSHFVSPVESSLTRSLMTINDDRDMQNIFSKIEEFLAMRKSTGTMVTLHNKMAAACYCIVDRHIV